MKTKWFKGLKIILPLFFGLYLMWYFYSSMSDDNKKYFFEAFKRCNYLWIVIGMALSIFAYFIRAWRWKLVLEPLGYTTSFWNRYHSLMIGYLINMTIPRAGEASRALMLYRSDKIPFASSFGTIIQERIVDLFMLSLLTGASLVYSKETFILLFQQIKQRFPKSNQESNFLVLSISIFLFFLLVFVGFYMLNKKYPDIKKKAIHTGKELIKGIFSLKNCSNIYFYILSTLSIWILYVVYFSIAFLCLPETQNISFEGILLAFILGAVGISFTNGGIGAFPLLVGLVVTHFLKDKYDNAHAIGNAIGMIIWVSQTILLLIMGLISLILLPKKHKTEYDESTDKLIVE
ncbi:MAG: flippase-like domain-containing protein [Flavobacteriia bacterium]|nr:flippase-like domain-containing protein [Flavobacteriia bacterium]